MVVNYPSRSVPRLPGIKASAFVVADASTGQVLAAKDPHGWYRPASTLKVLTAVALIPLLNPDATVVASKQATSTVPNVVGLVAGRAYKISDLFTALLTISANDAAIALTQATGSFGQGMTLINAEARHLQADDTVAVDPNGLDAPGQHTSAYDLALIARQALKLPAFLKYDQTMSARFVVARRKAVELYNQNSLLTTYSGGHRREDRLDQRRGRHLRRDGHPARRHAHRDAAALPRADRDQLRGEACSTGASRRTARSPRSARWSARCCRPRRRPPPPPAARRGHADRRSSPARTRSPVRRYWPRPGSAAPRCSRRWSASPTAVGTAGRLGLARRAAAPSRCRAAAVH